MSGEIPKIGIFGGHCHTIELSDGGHTTREMIAAHVAKVDGTGNIPFIATTDHDAPPIPDFLQICREERAYGVPGAELSFVMDFGRDIRDKRVDLDSHDRAVASGIAVWWVILTFAQEDKKTDNKFLRFMRSIDEHNISDGSHKVLLPEIVLTLYRNSLDEFFAKYDWINKAEFGELVPDLKNAVVRNYKRHEQVEGKQFSLQRYRAETLVYWPPRIFDKVSQAIKEIYMLEWSSGSPSLAELMSRLSDKLGNDFQELVFILAHPESIDKTWWGKLINKAMMGNDDLDVIWDSIETGKPELAKLFHGMELINGGHPDFIRESIYRKVYDKSASWYVPGNHLGLTLSAGDDAHSKYYVDAAYNILPVQEPSADAILDALRKGEVVPMWGLQSVRWPVIGTYMPFILWSLVFPHERWIHQGDKLLSNLARKGVIFARNKMRINEFVKRDIQVVDRETAQRHLVYAKLAPLIRPKIIMPD